ncbi:uncharacterized protein LOC133831138 isoform X2 [Humulus lupulus]|uniref:uncharacterized protein LOC133831138 isoform X2 n=1 Tax=Humulus lupulus TaxID=3486 RepID=UPI002B407937|nr:uncharacterized protein LOC133831138 isoform X2 [Humulus lupulus]
MRGMDSSIRSMNANVDLIRSDFNRINHHLNLIEMNERNFENKVLDKLYGEDFPKKPYTNEDPALNTKYQETMSDLDYFSRVADVGSYEGDDCDFVTLDVSGDTKGGNGCVEEVYITNRKKGKRRFESTVKNNKVINLDWQEQDKDGGVKFLCGPFISSVSPSPQEEAMVNYIFKKLEKYDDMETIALCGSKHSLSRRQLKTLGPDQCLSSSLINMVAWYLTETERAAYKSYPNKWFLPTRMTSDCLGPAKAFHLRSYREDNLYIGPLFMCREIPIPIVVKDHFVMILIYMRIKTVEIWDSKLESNGTSSARHLVDDVRYFRHDRIMEGLNVTEEMLNPNSVAR